MPQVLEFSDVVVRRNARDIVDHLDWSVNDDERWVILGPNGAGKTTLLQLADTLLHPTSGTVTILGERLGRTDVFELRPRIGFASSAMAKRVPPDETVLNVVLTAALLGARSLERGRTRTSTSAARCGCSSEWQLDHLADRTFGTLSDGEQKRVQIARAIMTDPELLLLDEPAASLDLGAREELLHPPRRLRAGPDHARDGDGDPPRRRDPGRLHARAAAARRRGRRQPVRSPRRSPPRTSRPRSGCRSR